MQISVRKLTLREDLERMKEIAVKGEHEISLTAGISRIICGGDPGHLVPPCPSLDEYDEENPVED